MDTKGGKPRGGEGGGVMNWAFGIDMYTLMCIKLLTNKNLLYEKKKKEMKAERKSRLRKDRSTHEAVFTSRRKPHSF